MAERRPSKKKDGKGVAKRSEKEKLKYQLSQSQARVEDVRLENEALACRVKALEQELLEFELVNAEAQARVDELEDAARDAATSAARAEDELLSAGAAEVTVAVSEVRATHARELRRCKDDHAAALKSMEDRCAAALKSMERRVASTPDARTIAEYDDVIAATKREHAAALARVQREREELLASAEAAHASMQRRLDDALARRDLSTDEARAVEARTSAAESELAVARHALAQQKTTEERLRTSLAAKDDQLARERSDFRAKVEAIEAQTRVAVAARVEPETPEKFEHRYAALEDNLQDALAECQAKTADLQDARKATLDAKHKCVLLEADLETLKETYGVKQKRLGEVLDAKTVELRLASETARVELLKGTYEAFLAARPDEKATLQRVLAKLLDVDLDEVGATARPPRKTCSALGHVASVTSGAIRRVLAKREARTAL